MMKEFCADMGSTRKICVTESIYAAGINPVTEVKVTKIKDGAVVGEKDGKTVEFPCDYAVMAVGAVRRDGSLLEKACHEKGIGYYEVGDAGMARRAINATREAFDAALRFDQPEEHAYVSKPKKLVFLTGATGIMGQQTMQQLLSRNNRFQVRILARPSEKNKKLLKNTCVRHWKSYGVTWQTMRRLKSAWTAVTMCSISAQWYHLRQTNTRNRHCAPTSVPR